MKAWDYLSKWNIKVNLFVLTLIWISCAFNHTVLTFRLKYFPGNIYWNGLLSATSDLIGTILSGVVFSYIGAKKNFQISFAVAAVGGILMYLYIKLTGYTTSSKDVSKLYGFYILIAKLGICGAFNGIYCCFSDMFPPLFSVTAFGIANFFARFSSFFAP